MLTGVLDRGEWVVFALVLANQAGVPVFAAPALLGVGLLAANGDASVGVALGVAVGGALCADLAWYGVARWRGTWMITVLELVSTRTGPFVDEAQRIFLAHDRAWQFGARFVPELNPLAAAFAGAARIDLRRFLVGATTSAAVWACAWIGTGYLIAGATWSSGGLGMPYVAGVVMVSAMASVSVVVRPIGRAIVVLSRSLWKGRHSEPATKLRRRGPLSKTKTGGGHADASALCPGRDRAICRRVRVAREDEPA